MSMRESAWTERLMDWVRKEVTGLTMSLRDCSLSSASLYLTYWSAEGN